MKHFSESNVPQKIEICLSCEDEPSGVSIDGIPINNLCGVGIETKGDDADTCIVTIKISVEAHSLKIGVEQKPSPKA